MKITSLTALEVLDSRGNPTVETDIVLEGGATGRALVPAGASTGEKEAVELRDNDPMRYGGRGVQHAVANVQGEIAKALLDYELADQADLDHCLVALDGTPNKSRLGANALLAVSMAYARALAAAHQRPLYRQLADQAEYILPVPCLNVLNGGRHADNNVDFQEFMLAAHNAPTFAESIRMSVETFHALKALLKRKGYSIGVDDEGGFAPSLKSNEEAVELLLEAITHAGYRPGADISLYLDPASSELYEAGGTGEPGMYRLFKSTGKTYTSEQFNELWVSWVNQYPIVLLEDGMGENDWVGWQLHTQSLGRKIELVGDDIFCTNPTILQAGIDQHIANSVLIKLNQIGTVTETLDTVRLAQRHHYHQFVSHRSGETEDTFVADLTVAIGAGHLKTGSGSRSERLAKFNQLLRIERELGSAGRFAGIKAFKNQ